MSHENLFSWGKKKWIWTLPGDLSRCSVAWTSHEVQACPGAPPHGGVQPLCGPPLPSRQPAPHLGSSSHREYLSAWSYNLLGTLFPGSHSAFWNKVNQGPSDSSFRWFQKTIVQASSCISPSLSLSLLFFSLFVYDRISRTLTILTASSGYTIICQLLS